MSISGQWFIFFGLSLESRRKRLLHNESAAYKRVEDFS
jgi:hypothetical protein